MIPQLWEALIYILIECVNLLYQMDIKSPEIGQYEPSTKDYIIGLTLILMGIAIFTIFHLKSEKTLKNYSDTVLENLLIFWKNARDISKNPKDANQSDVVSALNLVNETSAMLSKASNTTLDRFFEHRGDDFLTLYNNLMENDHRIESKRSRDLLRPETHMIIEKLEK